MGQTTHFGLDLLDPLTETVDNGPASLNANFTIIDGALHQINLDLAEKAAAEHGHPISEITGLQDALNNKSATDHTHSLNDLSDVDAATSTNKKVLGHNGTTWLPVSLDASWIITGVFEDARLPARLQDAALEDKYVQQGAASGFLVAESNLDDVSDKVAARANLGVTAAIAATLAKDQNLADLPDKAAARANLGFGTVDLPMGGKKITGLANGAADDDALAVGQVKGLHGLTIAQGDLLYGSGADELARLAKGAAGQVLTMSGNVPVWGSAPYAPSDYSSGPLSITSGSGHTLTHNFGARPRSIRYFLECVTTEAGYPVGTLLDVYPVAETSSTSRGFSARVGINQHIIRFAVGANVFYVINDSGSATVLTNANWRLIVELTR